MGDRRLISYADEINEREKKVIYKVLDNYDFNVTGIKRVRSVYKVETPEKFICLKKMRHGERKIRNGNILVDELINSGFINVASYYKTKNGNRYVKYKKLLFYVTEWIDGEECTLNDITEAVNCANLLAQFHIATEKIDKKKLEIRNNLKNWPKLFSSNLNDMEKFKKTIEKKKIKNEFDLVYSNFIDNFYNRGMIALSYLNSSDYYNISKLAVKNKTLCHDSFYYQNIIKKDDNYYIIDLDSLIIDLHVKDLGKLIRRLMFKKNYQWDFEKARFIIDGYNSVKKLSVSEIEVMLALIVFPHKFWKLGKKRYIKHKGWNETKYMHKLNKLIRYNDLQQKFLEDYQNYYKNFV